MIDLNCDLGESFGQYQLGQDEAIMKEVTSVNIACGFHAGDPDVMKKTVDMAITNHLNIGAHPGFPDLQGFGRRTIVMAASEIYNITLYQLGALSGFLKAKNYPLHHVKPHGALYNMASVNEAYALAIVQAIKDFNPVLKLYALSGSVLASVGEKHGLTVYHEVFADRTYQADGTLTPRTQANALIHDEKQAVEQVLGFIQQGKVRTVSGEWVSIKADTVCVHGDSSIALSLAKRLRQTIEQV
ncbi:UPF0271 protein [Bacillus oleivorans]|uniref:5-oxoprolinase subunit A n=1 Tax=Bacillus oleivorans TaxID=1448271 RepID=A0A285CLK0_9BACI|nr:5-oxoprolinase subunit PxpA [Bacillus oleivorans]SNX68421.1 UPF0271 protein [Bacillus oleivorans]